MATFEDNAVVTAEDLNNIAVDLGNTTFSAFSDEKFGVEKLNEITADLVGKGILTSGDRCEPIISDGKVYIKSGVIVFGSGAKIKITEPVEVVAVAGDYIYAYNDVLTGKANIIATAEMPTTGDYVMLAQINDVGTVVDLREMAVAKITLAAELQNNYVEQAVELNRAIDWYAPDENGERESYEVNPNLSSCRMLILKTIQFKLNNNSGVFVGVELSESFQSLINSSEYRFEVKKVRGKLYFRGYGSGYTPLPKGFEFTFLLA